MKSQMNGTISVGTNSPARQNFESDTPSAGKITNVSADDSSPVMMNLPELKPRSFRADQLIDMAADDGSRLAIEAPRTMKMKG